MQSHTTRANTASLESTARRLCESRGGRWSDTKGMARCPAHDDRTPSLGVILGRHAILLHCFAGCDQASVIQALKRDGMATPWTRLGPKASTASVAVTAESMPPERPTSTSLKPHFRT